MKKSTIANKIATELGVTNSVAKDMVSIVFDSIIDEVVKGGEVFISGFGKFFMAKRAARNGVNPQTGAKIKIAASKSLKFKMAKAVKDLMNAKK